MKTIVKVLRLKDNKARLYKVPDGVEIARGTLVSVEFPNEFCLCTGVAMTNAYAVDGETEEMVMDMHKMTPAMWDAMLRVIAVYTETRLDWPVDQGNADADADPEDGEPEDDDGENG